MVKRLFAAVLLVIFLLSASSVMTKRPPEEFRGLEELGPAELLNVYLSIDEQISDLKSKQERVRALLDAVLQPRPPPVG